MSHQNPGRGVYNHPNSFLRETQHWVGALPQEVVILSQGSFVIVLQIFIPFQFGIAINLGQPTNMHQFRENSSMI